MSQDANIIVTESGSDAVVVVSNEQISIQADNTIDVVDVGGTVEIITETQTETVFQVEPEVLVIETAEQGPPGPAHVEYPGKTITYSSGLVSEVRSYLDAAKTILAERRVLGYVGSVLSSIQFFNGAGALTKTRTLAYSGGVLSGYTDT